ncbi:hypothetical protein ABPG72_006139 [Tetrahymena utriculariae]
MFINYVSQDQIKQILSKNLLQKGMNSADQQPKKRKKQKKNNSEIRKCQDQKDEKNFQDSNNQHIKSQDVSLKKFKPDEQEEKIIRAYSQTPQEKETEQNKIEEPKKIQQNVNLSKNNENAIHEEKKQKKKSSEQHTNKKLNTNLSDIEKESHIQALNMLQSSPYSNKKQKNMIKNTLFPILEAKQFERQNKHRKLMPLKESVNLLNNNGSSYFQQLNNSFRQSIDIHGSNPSSVNSNYKFINQYLQRPRSSSQKVSPSRQQLQSGPVNPNKINYNTLQDDISFYTQNSYRNGVQINSFRSSSQNMQSEEKSLKTDYSQIIKNKKILDQTLYSTQFKPYKNSQIVLNQFLQYQDILEKQKNQDSNQYSNQINFYDDQNQRPNKYKIKIIRSSSSKKQNDTKVSTIEKIYKRKVSCILEQFSPNIKKKQVNSPKSKQKKKIQQLAAKDICLTQSQNSNINGDQSQQTIAETSQNQNK